MVDLTLMSHNPGAAQSSGIKLLYSQQRRFDRVYWETSEAVKSKKSRDSNR